MTSTIYVIKPFGAFGTGGGGPGPAVDYQVMVFSAYVDIRTATKSYMTPDGAFVNEN